MRATKRTFASLACGLCCALCVGLYLAHANSAIEQARAEALARYGGEQIEVCVATRDLAPGEVVSSADIASRLWVADLLPEGAVTDASQIVGQRLGSGIFKGEVVCARRAEQPESRLNVPEGMAALSVPARSVQAVGGSVETGMLVDVYATGPVSTSRLVHGALVLETSSSQGASGAAGTEWITLAIEPAGVQEVVAAAQNLELYFVLPFEESSPTTAPPSEVVEEVEGADGL